MSEAAKVQALPTKSARSVDVLDSLRSVVPEAIYTDLAARVELGVKKYGSRLMTDNGRDVLLDCREEALDGVMYGQQAHLQGQDDFADIREAFISVVELIDKRTKQRRV